MAGVGNAWLRDDGFGGEVARRLRERALPPGVAVMDAGTGGLDLAYEVMRGYDALVILDVSRQGGEPGTLYVMEPDEASVDGGDRGRRGDQPARHGSPDGAALRQVDRRVAGPGDRDRLRAGRRRGARLRPVRRRSQEAVERAVDLVDERRRAARDAVWRRGASVHELSLSGAIVNTVVKHADGRRVTVVSLRVGRLRQVVPDTLEFYFGFVARGTVCEGARLEQELVDARLRCTPAAHEWAIEIPAFRCPACGGSDVAWPSGDEFEVESIEVEEARMHRTKVRVVEEALDANNTIARANRADFDRAGVTVVNFMSAPGAGKTTLLERVVGEPARRARRRAGGRRPGLDGRRPPGRACTCR